MTIDPKTLELIAEGVSLGIEAIAGLVKAARAKTAAEEAAALDELDQVVVKGTTFVSKLRSALADGDKRVDAAADVKFGENT